MNKRVEITVGLTSGKTLKGRTHGTVTETYKLAREYLLEGGQSIFNLPFKNGTLPTVVQVSQVTYMQVKSVWF